MLKQSQKYDSTLRTLIQTYPRDFLNLLGVRPTVDFRLENVKVSTPLKEADKVFHLSGPEGDWLTNLELQTTYKPDVVERMHVYNVSLGHHHRLPVHSVLLLLRPAADGPQMHGHWRRSAPGHSTYVEFTYEVLRLWQIPARRLLDAGPGVAPLAPLGDLGGPPDQKLPALMQDLHRRWHGRLDENRERTLWADTFVLFGLRFEEALANQLMQGVLGMRESVTFQAILREGRAEGLAEGREEGREAGRMEGRTEGRLEALRQTLLELGARRFGPPTKRVQTTIRKLDDVDELQRLVNRLLDAESWTALLRR